MHTPLIMYTSLSKNKRKINTKTDFSVFDHFIEGFYALNKKWQYIYVNTQGALLAKMPVKELLGKRPQDVFPDAHRLEFGQTLRQVMKDSKPRTIEAFYPRYKAWYENIIFPIREGVGLLARDITKRKEAEEDQSRLSALVTSSDDAIIGKNLKSIITSWNHGAEKIFGYKAEEMIGKSIRTIIPPELQQEEDKILSKIKHGERVEHFRTFRIAKGGGKIPVSLMISPVKNSKGEIIGASKIARDISARLHEEENLKFLAAVSKELTESLKYEQILQNLAQLAVPHIADWCSVEILDATGNLEQVALAHKDPKKVKWARELRKRYPPRLDTQRGLGYVLRTGKSEFYPKVDNEVITAHAQDKRKIALLQKLQLKSVIIVPIHKQKQTIGAISLVTDESRREFTSYDLSIAEELGNRASLALENALLYEEMQNELVERKKLEKQKDEFIAVASHELKTPVTSIKSFAQLLHLRSKKEGRLQEAGLLLKLDYQLDKLTGLIGDLLDVTKIEGGRLLFNETTFNFDELIAETIEEMQRTTEQHTLLRKGKTNKVLIGDREKIGQVLINLISNAIKYSPEKDKVVISLSTDKKNIKVCVQDFGVGIRRDKLDKVFDRFFRVSGPNQETYPGLGLGLYISNEIIKKWNGKIWVESREGKGSTFCFTLPIKERKNENGK